MGHWGVKSYEHDEAADALDAGFDSVHGNRYEDLMDDRNPLTFEQVQERLADPRTLEASIAALQKSLAHSSSPESWDDLERLTFVGIIVRHAELGVPIPEPLRHRAIDYLQREENEWEEATLRRARRQKELALLRATSEN
jgi:hypothetical protein